MQAAVTTSRPLRRSIQISSSNFKNQQLGLFQDFLCNNDGERKQLSNTIELWDSIPRYSVSRQAMVKMRDKRGLLDLLKIEFSYRKSKFDIVIQPALIEEKDKDGRIITTAYYPSANEELVEEALRKLAVEQHQGFYDKGEAISGVVFSLHQLRKELGRQNHARSYAQIKLSLDILARSFIQIDCEIPQTKSTRRSTYFPEVVSVTRSDLDEDEDSKWMVRFHPLVAQSIENISYRQFNYVCLMMHTRQLTRWLHKLLIIKYIAANKINNFQIRYSTIKRDSAMLNNYQRERKAQEECDFCLKELKKNKVLLKFESHLELGVRGKVNDIVYTVFPTDDFIAEAYGGPIRQDRNQSSLSWSVRPSRSCMTLPHCC